MSLEQVIVTDEKTGAKKGVSLDRYDLIPHRALEELAKVYGRSSVEGGGKYPARNWEKGYSWGWSFRAMIKHAFAHWRGEAIDPEDGLFHLSKVAWHSFTLLMYFIYKLGTDDRSKMQEVDLGST